MKPIIRYILASALALSMLFLTSCQTAQQVDPDSYKIVLSSNPLETEKYYGNYQSETAAVTKTITFYGKEYVGEYKFTTYKYDHKYPTDVYVFQENGQLTGEFYLHANTGSLAWFHFSPDSNPADQENEPLEESILEEIARSYASEVDSLDGRKMTKTARGYNGKIEYSFLRYVNGYPTEDNIRVFLYTDGRFSGLEALNIGMFSEGIYKTETDILHPETCEELIRQHCENPVIEISNLTYRATFSGKIYVITKLTLDDGDSQYYQPMLLWVEWKTEESASGST